MTELNTSPKYKNNLTESSFHSIKKRLYNSYCINTEFRLYKLLTKENAMIVMCPVMWMCFTWTKDLGAELKTQLQNINKIWKTSKWIKQCNTAQQICCIKEVQYIELT